METTSRTRIRRLPPEAGVATNVWQLTDWPCINHHLYFTHASVSPAGHLLWVSYHSGSPALYRLSLADLPRGPHVEQEVTVHLVAAVPDLHPFSPCLVPGEAVTFTAGDTLYWVPLAGGQPVPLARFPGATLGGCHPMGVDRVTVPVYGPGESRHIAVVALPPGSSGTTPGTARERVLQLIEVPRELGYVQACPIDPELLLYSSGISQRMWLVRADRPQHEHVPLYRHDEHEWITHESWLAGTDVVLFTHWPYALKAIRADGTMLRTVAPGRLWHAASSPDGRLVVADTARPDQGLRLVEVATGRDVLLWEPRSSCRGTQWDHREPAKANVTEETYGPQWTHPHPSFSPDGHWVICTSDRTGYPQVYAVEVPASWPG